MAKKYMSVCPECKTRYECIGTMLKHRCEKCGAELVAEDEEKPNEADSRPVRGENTQPVYTCEKERGSQMRITNGNSGDDCAWANAVKAMGWVAVVVASLYGFIGAGIGGLILGLLASMLAVSGIMMIADMAKDIRRIRMMMEEDQIDR